MNEDETENTQQRRKMSISKRYEVEIKEKINVLDEKIRRLEKERKEYVDLLTVFDGVASDGL